ncbi:hypothetical protein [Microbacterium sp. ABRD28]|uniref:hypothetical protein n=1 Tax=Microbacterium sp. ABRD28 TaxID=2268461 RepID=UPI000F550D89|nr:hypothetical protein [Microbacterium sp. ABRD28]AZC14466.1 hypothetical protein DT073_12800 [Microbacterium sp. ABRD28]
MSASALGAIEPLDWFPKQFQPGDMDSTGGDRLLGRTELSPLEILIRETAQNSWDARRDGRKSTYGLHLRRIDWRMRADLARLLPDNEPVPAGGLPDNPYVLEIYDRGTTGLNGPVTLRPVLGDNPRNFQDLILKVGVPRDDGKGGGTYGLGKTASYAFSQRGTVVYWTRCFNEQGVLEHRLIASAFRDSYVEAGVQFTGRHWWGVRDGDTILPLIGDAAEALGSRLFARGYEDDETGTSMLIVDPDLTRESLGATDDEEDPVLDLATQATTFAAKARSAIRVHLWPKLITLPDTDEPPMELLLEIDNSRQRLIDAEIGTLALWGAGLNAIRAHRARTDASIKTPQGFPVHVVPITRYQQTLGHLAFVQRFQALERTAEHDDLDPTRNPAISRIALMRGQPELIVATVDWIAQTPLEGLEWLAVYKSADDWDAVYARTEPPAHDSWIASSGGEEGLVVKATRTKIISAIREALYPEPAVIQPAQERVRTGALSRRLGALLPTPHEPRTDTGLGPPDRGDRRSRASARIRRIEASPPRLIATYEDGRQRQSVGFVVQGGPAQSLVRISVSVVGDEGVHEPLDVDELEVQWIGADASSPSTAVAANGVPVVVQFTGTARRALRIDLSAEDVDGDH